MSCVELLEDIEKECDITLGFQSEVLMAEVSKIASIAAAVDGVSATITMAAGKLFARVPISLEPGKNKITATLTGDSDGSTYENMIELVSPGLSGAKNAQFSEMRKSKGFVILATDKDGKHWILGDLENPLVCTPGMQHGDSKANTLTAKAYSKVMPIEYSGTTTALKSAAE